MKKIFLYGAILLSLSACLFVVYYRSGRFQNTYSEIDDTLEAMYNLQIGDDKKPERLDSGKWYSSKRGMYHTLHFENNGLVIDNQADTIIRSNYKLNKDTLWLMIQEGAPIPNKINLHNDEVLVFESFIDKKEDLKYTRVNRW